MMLLRYHNGNIILLLCYLCLCSLTLSKVSNSNAFKILTHDNVIKANRADSDYIHDVIICIKQDIDTLDKLLLERSTPGSSKYQQWLTSKELADILNTTESYNNVKEYLDKYPVIEIKNVTLNNEYIIASAPISTWETIFNTHFYDWHDTRIETKKIHVLAEEYAIPNEIENYVDSIFNTVQLPPVINYNKATKIPLETVEEAQRLEELNKVKADKDRSLSTPPPPPPSYSTISFLNQLYDIPSNIGSSSLSQAVFQTNDEQFSPTDLAKFQTYMSVPSQAAIDITNRATTNCANNNCNEANLDIQYIIGIAQRTKSYVWWVDNTALNGNTFLQFLIEISSIASPPTVLSVSWGSNESGYPIDYINAFNTKAAALGVQGITILVSSGDDGVYGLSSNGCDCDSYNPSFPATSPYVTAVGATMGPNNWTPEVVCQSDINGVISRNQGGVITSGGGFSEKQARPSWQSSQVSTYLASTAGQSAVSGYGTGRGIPDVAFIGTKYVVSVQGEFYLMYGTSASAPLFGAMISLINANRLASGLGTVGFINPTLYSNSNKFNDITSGHNKCCSSRCCSSNRGFSAAVGWDAATGLGSIDFMALNAIYSTTSAPTVSPTYKPTQVSRYPIPSPTPIPTTGINIPSAQPTLATNIVFDNSFSINSISDLSVLLLTSGSQYYNYSLSIKYAIADNMGKDVDQKDITLLSIQAGRRLSRELAVNSIIVNFRVILSSWNTNTYEQVVLLFQENYNSGNFSQSLNTNAHYLNATGLVYAQVTSLSIGVNLLRPTLTPTSSPTEFYQNNYFYIAVAVAGVALLIFFISLIYYYRSRKLLTCYGLPSDFNVEDLRLVLPGIKSVRKLRTKVLITFTNNISATYNYRNCKNGIYYFDHRIQLQWASVLCFEKCSGHVMKPFERRQDAYTLQQTSTPAESGAPVAMQQTSTPAESGAPVAIALPLGRHVVYDQASLSVANGNSSIASSSNASAPEEIPPHPVRHDIRDC